MIDRERLKELKRKNAISNVCKRWKNNDISINLEDFLDIKETIYLQDIIMKKLEEMDRDNMSIVYEEQEPNILSIFQETLISNIDRSETYVFFKNEAVETGGIKLKGITIEKKLEFIMSESEFYYNGCSVFFSSINGDKGICIWMGEYDNRIYVW